MAIRVLLSILFFFIIIAYLYVQLPQITNNLSRVQKNLPGYCYQEMEKLKDDSVIIFGGSTSELEYSYLGIDKKIKKQFPEYINCSSPNQSFYEILIMQKNFPTNSIIVINYADIKFIQEQMRKKIFRQYYFTKAEMQQYSILKKAHKNYYIDYFFPAAFSNIKKFELLKIYSVLFKSYESKHYSNYHKERIGRNRKMRRIGDKKEIDKEINTYLNKIKANKLVYNLNNKTLLDRNYSILELIVKNAKETGSKIVFSRATDSTQIAAQYYNLDVGHPIFIQRLAEKNNNVYLLNKDLKLDDKTFNNLHKYFFNYGHFNIQGSKYFMDRTFLPLHELVNEIRGKKL